VYRLFFHLLSKYPGPLLVKVTDLYSVYYNYIGDIYIDALRCHERYKPSDATAKLYFPLRTLVRYGPSKLINNSAAGYSNIYSYGKNIGKGREYDTLAKDPILHRSILNTTDKKEHGRKRKVIGQGFTETALRGYKSIIYYFVKRYLMMRVTVPREDFKNSNYLSFDIIANVVFSYSLDLLSRPDNRFIVYTIDNIMYCVGVLL
ncbi:hypothetical protein BKA61DRAFT_498944, partial [Leptodontidium sp. MPI-SDFR-AT-0119]